MAPELPSPSRCARLALLALLGGPALVAQVHGATAGGGLPGQMFVCTDRAGHTHADRYPPAECRDRDVRELNPDGSLKRVIPAPLTREQRKKRDEEEEARLREEEQERAQLHKDRALLETYGSVDEIDSARRRDLSARQLLIDRANQRIAQYGRERKRLEDEAEFYQHREMPPELKERFENNKALVQQQEKTLADTKLEMQKINERYDADKQRYQELEEMARKAAEERDRTEREREGTPPQ